MTDAHDDPCCFCFQAPASRIFRVPSNYDTRDVPGEIGSIVRIYSKDGFPTCTDCAPLIKAKDQSGLQQRLLPLRKAMATSSRGEVDSLSSRICSGRLWQQLFWHGLTDKHGTVRVRSVVEPALKVLFDLFDVSMPRAPTPRFANGVSFYGWPRGDVLVAEALQSEHRNAGHASKVMKLLLASADLHGVAIVGAVESHDAKGYGQARTTEELYAWYARIGFLRDPTIAPNAIRREADDSAPIEERQRRLIVAKELVRRG